MRIVSLLPSATEIAFALGLGEELVGVTDGCDFPPEARELPVVSRSGVPDAAALEAAEPDLVIAPDESRPPRRGAGRAPEPGAGADATSHPGADATGHPDAALAAVLERLDADVAVLRLAPSSIEGILNAIQTVGAMTESEDAAMFVVEGLRERLQAVEEIVVGRREHGFRPPRVAALGGFDPPRTMGLWVPDQVRLAGGWELLGSGGEPSSEITWDAVHEVEPEIVVLMPPALNLPATMAAWRRAPRPDGWAELPAVRDGRAFAVDGRAHFGRPGPRVIDGIEVLTELIDPIAFDGMAPPESWARLA